MEIKIMSSWLLIFMISYKPTKNFVSGHPGKSARLIFFSSANISYSLILRSQLPTPALAARPTLHKCNAAKEKFVFSLQKQTWIIKRTLSIWIITSDNNIQETLDVATDPWGVTVERVELKDVRWIFTTYLNCNSILFVFSDPTTGPAFLSHN